MPTKVDLASPVIETKIVELLACRAPGSSICPSDVARAIRSDAPAWRALMPAVREMAVEMARRGQLRITRGTEPLDPADLGRGPIRLRRP